MVKSGENTDRRTMMINSKDIISALKSEYASGMTYEEIAKKHGVSYTYIHNLFSGKRSVDGLTLKKINKLFPDAILHLYGDKITITANQNHGNVVGVNHGGAIETDYLSTILDKILATEDLTAEEKIKVIKVLKK